MKTPRLALTAAVAALCIFAVPALAAPNRSTTLSASVLTFTWDGGPGNGIAPPQGGGNLRCTPVAYECDDTLVELKDAGNLTADIKAGSGSTDLDVRIIKSDAEGTAAASEDGIAFDETTNADAKTTARNLKPGFYVVRVLFFGATAGAYKGTLTFVPPPPPPPPVTTPPAASPTPAATPKPAKKKKASKKAACQKKAKKIKSKSKRKKALKKCSKLKG